MARGQLLSSIRALLKAEIRDYQGTNTDLDTEYNYLLANKQRELASQWDWSFLKHDWDLSCTAGTRYFDIPTVDTRGQSVDINFERPLLVNRLFASYYEPVYYGISVEDYNYREDTTEPLDPIQKWQLVTNANEASNPDEIEVWPVPATTHTLRFTGQRVVQALTSDSHKADLDDLLLVYSVAADILAMREQPNEPIMLKRATDRLNLLRGSMPTIEQCHVFGKSGYKESEVVKIIAIA
jgi:hypothetical protein